MNSLTKLELREASPGDIADKDKKRPVMGARHEIRTLLTIINRVAWVNLVVGLLNVLLSYPLIHRNEPLLVSGLLSVMMFFIMRAMIKHTLLSRNWLEACSVIFLGVLFPSFILWISVANMTGVIAH
jgi:hypothetical protein